MRRRLMAAFWTRLSFKSQKGQDRWVIFEVMPFKRRGFFVDLAAADGVLHSNTYALEKRFGWRGLCIEANPHYHTSLLQQRRGSQIVTIAVDEYPGEVVFRVDNGPLGGIVADDTDNSAQVRGEQLRQAELLTLKAEPLADILDRHGAPPVIDYLSLDVEGSEERILRSFPFDRYTFRCATIERPTPVVNQTLFDAGYRFAKNVRFDTFYVHESVLRERRLRLEPFEQVPSKDW